MFGLNINLFGLKIYTVGLKIHVFGIKTYSNIQIIPETISVLAPGLKVRSAGLFESSVWYSSSSYTKYVHCTGQMMYRWETLYLKLGINTLLKRTKTIPREY